MLVRALPPGLQLPTPLGPRGARRPFSCPGHLAKELSTYRLTITNLTQTVIRGSNLRFGYFSGNYSHVDGRISCTCRTPPPSERSSFPLWKRAAKAHRHRRLVRRTVHQFIRGARNGLIGRTGKANDGHVKWTGKRHGTRIGGRSVMIYLHATRYRVYIAFGASPFGALGAECRYLHKYVLLARLPRRANTLIIYALTFNSTLGYPGEGPITIVSFNINGAGHGALG